MFVLITISNTRSERVNENINRKKQEKIITYFANFGVAIIEIPEAEEHVNSANVEITSITPVLQAFLEFFQLSLAFNIRILHFGILVEVKIKWKLKVKIGISVLQ